MFLHHFCHVNVINLVRRLSLFKLLRWYRLNNFFNRWFGLKKLSGQIVLVSEVENLFTFNVETNRR